MCMMFTAIGYDFTISDKRKIISKLPPEQRPVFSDYIELGFICLEEFGKSVQVFFFKIIKNL